MNLERNSLPQVQPLLEILEPRLLLDGVGDPDPVDIVDPIATPMGASSVATFVDSRQFNPSSRMGGLIISEIMYNPVDPDGVGGYEADDFEFIEIYNSEEVPNDLSGYELTGEVDYVFPEGTVIPGRSYLVVAANPAAVEWLHGISGVLGPYDDFLGNDGGTIRLRNQMNAILQDIQYSDDYPWPAAADGGGHSLVMMRPDFGEDSVLAWEASDYKDGNPGAANETFLDNMVDISINEVLAHTDFPDVDFVELYNHSNASVNLAGLVITDDTDPDDPLYVEFEIPSGTTIGPRGFVSFTESELGFSLDMQGDRVYLRNLPGDRMIDAVKFGAQQNGVSIGRSADGSDELRVLSSPTPGGANADPMNHDIVINEIMYHPISQDTDDEFIEIYNRGASTVDLSDWRFIDGVGYTFPAGATIGAGEYLVIAKNALQLIAHNPGVLDASNTLGDYSGSLSDRGERVVLARPDDPLLPDQDFIVIDEVSYTDGESWGTWADGGGSSLELSDPHSDNMRASNWSDSDETDKAPWTLIEHTGVLDHGRNPADEIQIFLEGAGEALIDNIEVFKSGQGNVVGNGTFESGIGGWIIQGTHINSHLDSSEGYLSSRSLHLVSSRGGDNSVNRVEYDLSSALSTDATPVTIRAQVRWQAGTPGILMRLHGNWLEAPGFMDIPTNLGTPGAVNSNYAVNAGPAIYDVTHLPILPTAGQNVVVTARVSDVDGLGAVNLHWRNDTDNPYNSYTVAMNDSGHSGDSVAGDGVYSATIPGQGTNDLVAFYVEAVDSHATSPVYNRFPTASDGEAHVMFGQSSRYGTFGTYRFWVTEADRSEWASRQKLSDHPIHGTFVYGDFRAIYNAGGRFRGSPFIRSAGNPETMYTSYVFYVPKDSRVIGSTSFNLDRLEDDGTKQRERMSLWLADQVDTPFFNMRYVHLFVNENSKSNIYSDSHSPNDDFVNAYWSDGTDGELFKIDDWFEFNDSSQVSREFNDNAQLRQYTTTGGELKQARYRWSWRKEPMGGFNDDYTLFFDLVNSMNHDYQSPEFAASVPAIVDYDEWMHVFAIQHIINNWDSYGFNRGKNMSLYMPDDGRWQMIMWDLDHSHMTGSVDNNNLFSINDPILRNEFFNYPLFRRTYWRAIYEVAQAMEASKIDPVMDANYAAFQANGIYPESPGSNIKGWVAGRRTWLLGQVAAVDSSFAITTNGGADYSTGSQIVTINGTAPVAVKTMKLNGVEVDVEFTSITGWELQLGLSEGDNLLEFEGYDFKGNLVASDSITVTFTNTAVSPVGQIMINEIMYNPAAEVEQGEFIEIYNASGQTAFDMSGWRMDGVDMTFAPGSIIAAGQYAVIAENAANFIAAYGSAATVLGEYGGSLSNGGERLRLQMPDGNGGWTTVSTVSYNDALPWPAAADGTGPSLQLMDPSRRADWIGNWSVDATTHYTPGEVNSVYEILPGFPEVKINEILTDNAGGLTDNAGDNDPWMELYNTSTANVLAVEVHQADPDGGDVALELSLDFTQPAVAELSFQNGVDGYNGSVDTEIRASNPTADLSAAASINVDGSDGGGVVQAVIRFDDLFGVGAGQISPAASIIDATLTLEIHDPGDTMRMHRMLGSWAENANWDTFVDGVSGDGVEAAAAYQDVSGSVGTRTIDVTQAIQEWRAGTAVNNGWVLIPTGGGGVDFHSSESGTVSFRPKLTVTIDDTGTVTEVIPFDAAWKYLDDGSDQGAAWRESEFDDGGWASGQAIIGYGNGDEATTVAAGATTYYFRHEINLPQVAVVNPEMDIRTDDGVIVYLNGTEIYRANMPAGPVDFTTTAQSPIEGPAEADFAQVGINPGLFIAEAGPGDMDDMYLTDDYAQLLKWAFPAGSVLETGQYMTVWLDGETAEQTPSDMHANFTVDGLPGSLALVWNHNGTPIVVDYVSYDYTPTDQSQGLWPNGKGEMFAMATPTPSATNSGPLLGQLVVNELHYNPSDDSDYEFIEIYNRGPSTLDLWESYGGVDYPWKIEGFEFAPGATLPSGELMVVVSFNPVTNPTKLADFRARYGLEASSVQIVGSYGANLDNGGEMVRVERPLEAPSGAPVPVYYETLDALRYDDEAPWPIEADGLGDSLHRVSIDAWGSDQINWVVAPPNPAVFALENLPPNIINPIADIAVDEDSADDVLDLSATFEDNDEGDYIVMSVSDNSNPGLLAATMDGTDLTLSYVADENGSADITIRATDSGGRWVEDTFTVTVYPLDDDPILSNPIVDFNVDEDAGDTIIDLSTVFDDPDLPGDTLAFTLESNSNPALVDVDLTGGTLTLSYAADSFGSADIVIRATDQNGAGAWVEDSFTVTVDPVNDAPTVVVPIADVTVDEDADDTAIDLSGVFDDVDLPGDALTFTVWSNTNASLVSANIVDSELTLSYGADRNGSAGVTIRATDSSGLYAAETFGVTVDPIEDDPVIVSPIEDFVVVENAADTDIDLRDVFHDAEDGVSMTYTVESNSNPSLVSANIAGSDLTLSYAAQQVGSADMTIRATDSAGGWIEDVFAVTVEHIAGRMEVRINLATGGVAIANIDPPGGKAINYNGLEIISTPGLPSDPGVLDETDWMPIGHWNIGTPHQRLVLDNILRDPDWSGRGNNYGSFGVLSPTPSSPSTRLFTEASLTGYALLQPGAMWGIGNPIVPGSTITPIVDDVAPGDFEITYTLSGQPILLRATDYVFVDNFTPLAHGSLEDVSVLRGDPDTVVDLSEVFADFDTLDTLTYTISGDTSASTSAEDIVGDQLTLSYGPGTGGVSDITVRATDPSGAWVEDAFTVTVTAAAEVAARHVFYDNSAWDGVSDDDAIDASKAALLPGQTASAANWTSCSRGINGIMVDVTGLAGAPDETDFLIEVNQHDDPDTWTGGPSPTVSVRSGEGVDSSDRVVLTWSDGEIVNQWVRVTVLATPQTGLSDPDVFGFGSAVGDVDGDGAVDDNDLGSFQSEFGLRGGFGALANDLDADGRVGLKDFAIMRSRFGETVLAPTLPVSAPLAAPAPGPGLVTSVNQSPLSNPATNPEGEFAAVSVSELSLPQEADQPASAPAFERELTGVLSSEDSSTDLQDDLLVDVLAEAPQLTVL